MRVIDPDSGHIVLHIDEIACQQGLVNADGHANLMALERATGLAYTTLWKLVRDPDKLARIELATLSKLCNVLGCQPGDLMTFEETKPSSLSPLSDAYKRGAGEWGEEVVRDEQGMFVARTGVDRAGAKLTRTAASPSSLGFYVNVDDEW